MATYHTYNYKLYNTSSTTTNNDSIDNTTNMQSNSKSYESFLVSEIGKLKEELRKANEKIENEKYNRYLIAKRKFDLYSYEKTISDVKEKRGPYADLSDEKISEIVSYYETLISEENIQ